MGVKHLELGTDTVYNKLKKLALLILLKYCFEKNIHKLRRNYEKAIYYCPNDGFTKC